MAYTLASIRQRVLNDKLDDTSFDPDIVDNFINDTQRDIFNTYELPFTEKVFAGLLPVDEYIFAFPDDFQVLQSLKITDPDDNITDITQRYVSFRDFNNYAPVPLNNEAGVPGMWTLHGERMYFDRPTDQAYTLELYYIKKPAELTDDSDEPDLPEEWGELLVLGAYIRILERNEDFDLAAYYRNGQYADLMDKMVGRLGKRHMGKTHVMGQPRRILGGRRSGRR